jgi:purine nucleoside permease
MIQAKFGLNWPGGFRGDDFEKVYSRTTDDGRLTPSDGNTSHDPLGQVSKKGFEDINRVIIIHKSKDRQHQKKKDYSIKRFFSVIQACDIIGKCQ